jgi:hypothetical protein
MFIGYFLNPPTKTTRPVDAVADHPNMASVTRKESTMFWIFLLFVGAAASFVTLGIFSVLFKIMSLALMAAGITVLLLLIHLVWRKASQK